MNSRKHDARPLAQAPLRNALIAGVIFAACVLALLLRLRQAEASLALDEFASLYFADHSFGDLWGWWLQRETNPPLFYSALRLWRMVVPESPEALRLLPLLLSLAQIALVGRFAGKTYGWLAGAACVLLFALSPSDIYQSDYIRGYVLAKLAVTLSFVGLVAALEEGGRNTIGWAAYVIGAAAAIYSHTTMLLWPVIATLAVTAEAACMRSVGRRRLIQFLAADLAVAALASWQVLITVLQIRAGATDIGWIERLSPADFAATANLQLLLGGGVSSLLMGALVVVGVLRTIGHRVTRLALFVVILTLASFKSADLLHPITTDFTLHWCATFTVLLAGAAFAPLDTAGSVRTRRVAGLASVVMLAAVAGDGLFELEEDQAIPIPQNWQFVIDTTARSPGTALLVSHESVGVVVAEACKLRFHAPLCPFPLIVLKNPAPSDSWSVGGYARPLIPPQQLSDALGAVRQVFVFSRYVYTPLAQLGMDPRRYRHVEWEDGELIGPIPRGDFAGAAARNVRR